MVSQFVRLNPFVQSTSREGHRACWPLAMVLVGALGCAAASAATSTAQNGQPEPDPDATSIEMQLPETGVPASPAPSTESSADPAAEAEADAEADTGSATDARISADTATADAMEEPAHDGEPAPEPATPDVDPVVEVVNDPVATPVPSDLVAYLGALDLHVAKDPGLAAAYAVFWSELRDSVARQGSVEELSAESWAGMTQAADKVKDAVRTHYRGVPPTYAAGEALEVAARALSQVDSTQQLARNARDAGARQAERLLASLNDAVMPSMTVNGRYEFAGDLERPADLGFGAEVWMVCRQSPACITAHDRLFADAMAGTSLIASVPERLHQDLALAAAPTLASLLDAAARLDAQVAAAGTGIEAVQSAAGIAARDYWRMITRDLVPDPGASPEMIDQAVPDAIRDDAHGLDALFTVGRAGAYLAGQENLANAFAVTRSPAVTLASALAEGALLGAMAPHAASMGMLVAATQALALFGGAEDNAAPAELRQLVETLSQSTNRTIMDNQARQMLATNTVDARVAAIGIALDVVKTDIARLESAGERRIASDYQAAAARRWTDFDADNERCFGLRNRDSSGRLRPNEFRRCEDHFLQGATRRARYANRATEYVLDPRFIDPAEARFPFHDHYPLLATRGGVDSRAALELVDPLDWQQHAAALLRLYRENPAGGNDRGKRYQSLSAVMNAGRSSRDMLAGLAFVARPDGTSRFRSELHQQLLDGYFAALTKLVTRVDAIDDPAAHPFGKRLSIGLEQPLPQGPRRAAIEAALAPDGRQPLRTCSDAPETAFLPETQRLHAESRRFFGDPVQPQELAVAWNRTAVNGFGLEPASYIGEIPAAYVWASLEGLGRIELCLARFRPEAVAFTREKGPAPDTLLGTTLVSAELEVRFYPDATVGAQADLGPQGFVILQRSSDERSCTFGYRNDQAFCSRAQCLPALARQLWNDDTHNAPPGARCDGDPLARSPHSTRQSDSGSASLLIALEDTYRAVTAGRLEQLAADVARSNEYAEAAGLYLEYYALAGVTLDPARPGAISTGTAAGSPLTKDGLAGPAALVAPHEALMELLGQGGNRQVFLGALAARLEQAREQVTERGRELETRGALTSLTHIKALDVTLERLSLAASAYAVH